MTPRFLCTIGIVLGLGTAVQAAEPVQQHNSSAVWFENWIGLSHASLRVASPDGRMTDIWAESGTPVFELTGSEVVEGVYRYELRAQTDENIKNPDRFETQSDGKESSEDMKKPFYTTGYFIVERGVIVEPKEVEEERGDN